METFVQILTACAPIMVALVGIIPTVVANRKKTEKSLKESREETKTQVAKLQKTLDDHIKEDEDAKARTQRYRILRFYDEMCEGRQHSESHFEDILADIDDYEKFCDAHPLFKNSRGKAAMSYIKDTYAKLKASGRFLTHKDDQNAEH